MAAVMEFTPEQWALLGQWFDEAVALALPEREALIARVRHDEGDALADKLAALLRANDDSTHAMDEPFVPPLPAAREEKRAFQEGEVLLGRFRIVRLLGRGGMGEVYEAYDQELGPVALKTIRRDLAGDQSVLRRFKQEVLLARQVTSPYVCRIHELFTLPETGQHTVAAFLTMELLAGATLAKRIELGILPWSEAEPIAIKLCQGLDALHAVGLVHRDFKPANAMLFRRGDVTHALIMDFGLALRPDESLYGHQRMTRSGGIIGTPGYMAPEQREKGARLSPATDVYALGLVIYEMLTGEHALAESPGDRSAGSATKRLIPASTLHDGIPHHVDRVIAKCLEDRPADRFQAAGEVAKALRDKGFRVARTSGVFTRRRTLMVAGTAALALAWAGIWEREELESFFDQLSHPLPRKRFVAVLAWPTSADHGIQAALSGVVDAIENELSRAEAFDSNFYVVASHSSNDGGTSAAKLAQVVDPLGTNLVLAAFGALSHKGFELTLKLLDPSSGNTLRAKLVPMARDELGHLPARAVETAASLLGVSHYVTPGNRLLPPATSSEAFKALQAADALRKLPDDTGLEASIEKYKEAIELDSHFAAAHSRLAIAYVRLHALMRDPAALELAEENARAALNGDANLVEGYLAMSYVFQYRDDPDAALAQMSKAVSLDPSNPVTRVWQADLYTGLNRLPEAESTCRLVIKSRPNFWLAHQDLGAVFDRQCKYREALKEFRAASLAKPKSVLPLTNVAIVQCKLGMYPEAYETFTKSMALRPYPPAAWGLAQLLRGTGRLSEALHSARRAVELDPTQDPYWLELGDCYNEMGGHRSEARQAYLKALTAAEDKLKSSPDGTTWMLLALYRLKAGVVGSPAALLAKAEAMGATDPDSRLCKLRILELTGQRAAALDILTSCLRAGVTVFQVDLIPDLKSLRGDPRYLEISKMKPFQA
jgi:serine/threonine protein kinase/tetratricopeptide (TPR) repeat protein